MRTLEKFGLAHAIGLGYRHAVGVAEGPIETFLDAQPLGNPEHQSRCPGDQRRQQRMEEFPRLLDLHRVYGEALAVRPIANQFFGGVEIGDIYLDKIP